jgi:hydrogenase maturation protease
MVSSPMRRCAIYGIGNLLLGDDGVGPAVVAHLAAGGLLPPDVTLEDLGTPSLDLPGYLADYDVVIFIDAVAADGPPGSVHVYSREEILAAPIGIRISPHELTINDAMIVLDFAEQAPEEVFLVGIVPETLEGGICLSPAVAAAVPRAAEVVLSLRDRCQLPVASERSSLLVARC